MSVPCCFHPQSMVERLLPGIKKPIASNGGADLRRGANHLEGKACIGGAGVKKNRPGRLDRLRRYHRNLIFPHLRHYPRRCRLQLVSGSLFVAHTYRGSKAEGGLLRKMPLWNPVQSFCQNVTIGRGAAVTAGSVVNQIRAAEKQCAGQSGAARIATVEIPAWA